MSEQIEVIFKDGTKTTYAAANVNNIRRVFGHKIKKIVPIVTEESKVQNEQDIAVMREAAKQLGIKGHHNMPKEKLKAAIDKALKG